MLRRIWLGMWIGALVASAQPAIGTSPKVEFEGTITKVTMDAGQGAPSLMIKTGEGEKRVVLGSLRYLMEKNFNPKAGAKVRVKGFTMNQDVVAQRVEIPAEKMVLELRSDDGTPLWRGGRYRGTSKNN